MKTSTLFVLGAALALTLGASTAFAADISASVHVVATGTIMKMGPDKGSSGNNVVNDLRAKGDQEIAARVSSLNTLSANVAQMAHLTTDEKTSISASITGDISSLTTLQAKIDADATSSLKADVDSVTQGERIYMLVEPQVRILAAADRAASIGDMFTAVVVKIQARLTASPNSAAATLLADLQAKVADSQTVSAAALSETAGLQPDNGNAQIEASNNAALKDARSKINQAQSDLKAAQQDLEQILKLIMGSGSTSAGGSATTSASVR